MSSNFSYNETDRMSDPGFKSREKKFFARHGLVDEPSTDYGPGVEAFEKMSERQARLYWAMASRFFGTRCNGACNGYAGWWEA